MTQATNPAKAELENQLFREQEIYKKAANKAFFGPEARLDAGANAMLAHLLYDMFERAQKGGADISLPEFFEDFMPFIAKAEKNSPLAEFCQDYLVQPLYYKEDDNSFISRMSDVSGADLCHLAIFPIDPKATLPQEMQKDFSDCYCVRMAVALESELSGKDGTDRTHQLETSLKQTHQLIAHFHDQPEQAGALQAILPGLEQAYGRQAFAALHPSKPTTPNVNHLKNTIA